jgi:hypothetical protein
MGNLVKFWVFSASKQGLDLFFLLVYTGSTCQIDFCRCAGAHLSGRLPPSCTSRRWGKPTQTLRGPWLSGPAAQGSSSPARPVVCVAQPQSQRQPRTGFENTSEPGPGKRPFCVRRGRPPPQEKKAGAGATGSSGDEEQDLGGGLD